MSAPFGCKNHIPAIGQGAMGQRLERSPPHDDGMSGSQFTKMSHIVRETPEQAVVFAYRSALVCGYYNRYHWGFGVKKLYGNRSRNMRVRIISEQFEVFIAEVEDITYFRIEFHLREGTRIARQLQFHLLEMIVIDMRIAKGMDELTGFETGNMCNHLEQQRIRGDVERYPKEYVCTSLVELEAEPPLGNVELKKSMAGR